MDEGISRRELVAVASVAAAAVASCSNASSSTAATKSGNKLNLDKLDKPYEMRGVFPTYGANPNVAPEYRSQPQPTVAFSPRHIAIIHISAAKAWQLEINHAHFSVDPLLSDSARLARAITLIDKKGAKRFMETTIQSDIPYKRKRPPHVDKDADYIDFQKLAFGSQHEVFIYFDTIDISFKRGHLITFAPNTYKGAQAYENWSFFDANVVPYDEMGKLKDKGRMLRVRNYYTTDDGNPINDKADEILYAMNIHFEMRLNKTENLFVPMIIDPDTGNGSGNEP